MNRHFAQTIHETTNSFYWMENPDWDAGSKIGNFVCSLVQAMPISVHELQKKIFFSDSSKVTVSGESIVVDQGDTVDKYMFRYPSEMSTEQFFKGVESEIEAVLTRLGNQALHTTVIMKNAKLFRNMFGTIPTVTQTQPKLDLVEYPKLDLENLAHKDSTTEELEKLVINTERMIAEDGYHPDFSFSGGNLRVNQTNGDLLLIDLMPIHVDGTRLIGDSPSKLPHARETFEEYKTFIGRFGS